MRMHILRRPQVGVHWAIASIVLLALCGGCFRAQEAIQDELRREVVKAASTPGPGRALPLINQAVKNRRDRIRTSAAISLRADGEIQARSLAPLTVPLLSTLLGDESQFVRREAASSLATYGQLAKPALPQLRQRLREEPTADVAWFSLSAIANIGPGASDAIPELLVTLGNAQTDGWRGRLGESQLFLALGKIGPQAHEAVPVLMSYLDGYRNGSYRYSFTIGFVEEAATALARIDQSGKKLQQTIEWMSTSTDSMKRYEAMVVASAIAEFEQPTWLQELGKRGLEDPEAYIRRDWARTLEMWGGSKSVPDNRSEQSLP